MKIIIVSGFLIVTLFGCRAQENTVLEHNYYPHKSYEIDSVIGISLNRAYKELLKDKKGKKVIVAVIDTELDINHPELKNNIWTNKKEIPDNGIDDDNNGYIDDIHGWNYLGSSDGSKNIMFANYSYIRAIRAFEARFKNKNLNDILDKDTVNYNTYIKALKKYKNRDKDLKEDKDLIDAMVKQYEDSKPFVNKMLKRNNYTTKELSSLYYKLKAENKNLKKVGKNNDSIRFPVFYVLTSYRRGLKNLEERLLSYRKGVIDYATNLSYNDRESIGDKVDDLNFRNGNPNISGHVDKLHHATFMAGIIAANRNDTIGIPGINSYAQIMNLAVFSLSAGPTDKDLSLAIRYAVDNGAKVINISGGKEASVHKDWIEDAMKYAEKNKVIVVASPPNEGNDQDSLEYYPNDSYKGNELKNLIEVSLIRSKKLSHLITDYSNYGKKTVDLFAPGRRIESLAPNNKYRYTTGTSVSCAMVSGVASLILSYYPNLNPLEVKDIILKTVDKYDLEVKLKDGKTKHFSELSTSGGALNAYKALKLAEEISRNKK